MKTDAQIIQEFLEAVREDVIKAQADKGLLASGQSAASLYTKTGNARGWLMDGSGSFEYQERGRGAGKQPPIARIYEWLAFKKYGLAWATEAERKSLAYRIARKIAKRGTLTHIKKQPTGVLTDIITRARIEALKKTLGEKYAPIVTSEIINTFKAK